MKDNFLPAYIHDQLLSARKHVKKFRKRRKQKHIHTLRVAIKQLRAAFNFINKVLLGNSLPKKALKKIFKAAGLVREAHINLGLAKQLGYSGKVLKGLKKERKKRSKRFIAKTKRYLKLTEKLENKITVPQQQPGKTALVKYFTREVRRAGSVLKITKGKADIHQFRKKIKEIMYAYGMLPPKIKQWVGINEEYLNGLQLKAGNWHDSYAAIQFFRENANGTQDHQRKLKAKEKREYNSLLKQAGNFEKNIYA